MRHFIIAIFLSCQAIIAQVQFEARVSKNTLGLNERLRIDFYMNFDGDNFIQPAFEGFRIIAGPSQQVSQSWVNGHSSFEKMYSYFLVPTHKGVVVIKSATIEYEGKIYKTLPVKIVVTDAIPQPKDPNDISISADNEIHLLAEVSNSNPYLNEPITVVYKLYFSYNIGITNWKESNKPKYNDFWSQNIEIKQLVAQEGPFKGEKYRYIVLKKVVLYPQKSGKLSLEPLSLDVDLQLPSNRRDIFGRQLITESNKLLTTGTKTINVKPLPETGKPIDFTGAVGVFDFKVTPSKNNLKNGESLDLIVSLTGKGNLKLFSLPKPVVPNALEIYDPVHNETVTTNLTGMEGKITDTYTIVPQYKGNYPVKPMSFSYFDLRSKTYKTITASEVMINVLEGPTDSRTAHTNTHKKTVIVPEHFKFIKTKTNFSAIKADDFFGSNLFYALLLFPFLMIPVSIVIKNRKDAIDANVTLKRIKANNKLAKKYLYEAKKQLNNKELFYIALERALHNFLKAKLDIETTEMSKENIATYLLEKGVNSNAIDDFLNLTQNCEFARFAPASSVSIKQDFEKSVLILADLEKQIL